MNTKYLETNEKELERVIKRLAGYQLEWYGTQKDKIYFEGIEDTLSVIYGRLPVIRATRFFNLERKRLAEEKNTYQRT